jgi:hypothetical protein
MPRKASGDKFSHRTGTHKSSVADFSSLDRHRSGKTSTLNLVREHLGDKAITVSFSTWLPGSAETLTSYLLSDIANECKKHYVVPGLRQSTRRFALALGQKVPFLSDFLKVLPATTQRDDLENLKLALIRLPLPPRVSSQGNTCLLMTTYVSRGSKFLKRLQRKP